jgi:hypothetical protein
MSKCESCGVAWTDHLGITGTCKRVQDQAAEIERLKAEIKSLRESWHGPDLQEHPIGHPKMIFCQTCGHKRCPSAADDRYKCTGSNEPGQVGELRS